LLFFNELGVFFGLSAIHPKSLKDVQTDAMIGGPYQVIPNGVDGLTKKAGAVER
jgi:hypothetical protein